MATYLERLVEVDDFGVIHVKKEWVIEEPYMFTCTSCGHVCLTSASLTPHWTMDHASQRYDTIQAVYDWFSI